MFGCWMYISLAAQLGQLNIWTIEQLNIMSNCTTNNQGRIQVLITKVFKDPGY